MGRRSSRVTSRTYLCGLECRGLRLHELRTLKSVSPHFSPKALPHPVPWHILPAKPPPTCIQQPACLPASESRDMLLTQAEAERKAMTSAAGLGGGAHHRQRVSFSAAPHSVCSIPGSSELRGVDVERAFAGRAAFTR